MFAWEAFPVFAGLSPEALHFLKGKSREHSAKPQEIILREGELGNRMFFIQRGEVTVWKRHGCPDGLPLAQLQDGNFFGEMCILETLPRCATVEARTLSELRSLSSIDFYHLYKEMPSQYGLLVLNIARDLSRRLRELDEKFAGRH